MTSLKERILAAVASELTAIEMALTENLAPHIELVKSVAGHILFSGGKRLRPLLTVLSGRLCGYKGQADKTYATIFEYLHAATLLHDDVVDGGLMRRGQPAAHTIWDPATVVLTGDFLLSRGLAIAARTGLPEVIAVIARITEEMSQGEIQQLHRKGALDLTESEYLQIIRRKTAVLFEGACQVGAQISNAPRHQEAALATYGHQLGLAFQMADDLLDYSFDSNILGKGVGADLREGKLTLPVIFALTNAEGDRKAAITAIIQNPEFTQAAFETLVADLDALGGIAYTRQRAKGCLEKAKDALAIFPDVPTKQVLLDIADYALARKR
ncbi:MAG: polyprenyl synthetase family protein [Desulfosarcinaceae bacterium]|nr:polyprenyl synthetase family protein [Desulfosarcinaceae bacterium]